MYSVQEVRRQLSQDQPRFPSNPDRKLYLATGTRPATSRRPGQYKHLIRVAPIAGRMPERDVMLLWLTHIHGRPQFAELSSLHWHSDIGNSIR
jgi:hypothetical protein